MSLEQEIMTQLKAAMLAKDEAALRSLRAIKAAILLAKTAEGATGEMSSEAEIKLLQKMVKQRKDSLEIFQQQNRPELAQKEHDFTAPSIIENDCQVVFVWLANDVVSTATEKVVHIELGKACEARGVHAFSARGDYLCVNVCSRYLNLCHLWFPSYTTMLQHISHFVNNYVDYFQETNWSLTGGDSGSQ